jgi:hypothetical protein
MEELVKLFMKPKFYWDDFTVRCYRYRGSTKETKAVRAARVAGLKLSHVIGEWIRYQASLQPWPNSLSNFWFRWTMPGWKSKPRSATAMACVR